VLAPRDTSDEFSGMITSVNSKQSANALGPIVSTDSGIVIDVSALQPSNVLVPRDNRDEVSGIINSANPLQF
jgi:hypothetical protein